MAAVVALAGTLVSPVASAQTVAEVESRDSLIASQEALLNVYRCLFDVDTGVVPGGCADGKPTLPPAAAQPFDGVPAEEELARRDVLVARQEALLNVYRCLFDIDTEIVPGGCLDGAPAVPFVPPAADALFYSGLVDGPGACGELEGLEMYPSDQDGDGVAESCVLSDGAVAVVPVQPTFTELVSHTGQRLRFDNFTCGLQTDGAITCWGTSSYGVDSPPEGRFTALHVSHNIGCGITPDQTIACWGHDKPSTSSNPSQWHQSYNWTVADMEGQYTEVVVSGLRLGRLALGWAYACAIRADDLGISCWGYGGSPDNDPPEGQFTAITKSIGLSRCAIRIDQAIACWGSDASGATDSPPGAFTAVQTNGLFSCGIRTDQTLACWGNKNGEDIGQTTPPEGEFTAIGLMVSTACGIRADQAIACWGSNNFGQTDMPEGRFIAIDAGSGHACAIRTDQTLACWGSNRSGKADPPEGRFTSVVADEYYSCGIRVDGTAVCWGGNQWGRSAPNPPVMWQRQPTSIPDSRLMLVAEIVAEAPFYEAFAQPYAPSRGDVQAELRSCMDLGDSAQIDPGGASLALCSTAYRAATWAIDFALVDDPACAHEQFRALLTQPYDPSRLVGWADVCSSQLDPFPNGTWVERCRAVMGLVSPRAAEIPADLIEDEYCQPVTQQELDRWGRCIELIHLRAAGLRAKTTAKHPDNQWPTTLDIDPKPQDMRYWC
ncbi:RCC1 domain-containing protein [Candidatus Poriferisocius sp.]|uniref:RCC1 domain-containing protein n=1 Tax=Candidatus Poriferisocius sp. TaxID=3101276 RepID=UPI003B01A3B1